VFAPGKFDTGRQQPTKRLEGYSAVRILKQSVIDTSQGKCALRLDIKLGQNGRDCQNRPNPNGIGPAHAQGTRQGWIIDGIFHFNDMNSFSVSLAGIAR
jgi:hypothetical protein